MSDEDFLTRWSRRKRQAKDEAVEPVPEPKPESPDDGDKAEELAAEPEEEFDLASLPPIESITQATDVTVFLRKGVPSDLARAALRRAWVADPAIRDFVGLAENAWDFNDPNGIPGFGPLEQSAEEVTKLVSQVFGEASRTVEEMADGSARIAPANDSDNASGESVAYEADPVIEPDHESGTAPFASAEASDRDATNTAPQQEQDPDIAQLPRRSHGGALPH